MILYVSTKFVFVYTLLALVSQANTKKILALDDAKKTHKMLGCIIHVELNLLENDKDGGSFGLLPYRPVISLKGVVHFVHG